MQGYSSSSLATCWLLHSHKEVLHLKILSPIKTLLSSIGDHLSTPQRNQKPKCWPLQSFGVHFSNSVPPLHRFCAHSDVFSCSPCSAPTQWNSEQRYFKGCMVTVLTIEPFCVLVHKYSRTEDALSYVYVHSLLFYVCLLSWPQNACFCRDPIVALFSPTSS